jgi:4-amino-4-deoxy-L-arabinose transferase-like glycosyltransferase
MLFVLCTAVAVLLFLRAGRSGWPVALGAGVGVACGLAALTRQSAVVPIFCVLVGAVVAGRRRAVPFLATAVVAIALVAGPWWGYAYHTWGNPLQGNLDRPGFMLEDGQPRSFFVSFPLRSLVLHPYRPDLEGQLVPQLHADLWSDWFGAIRNAWADPPRLATFTASTQSVLGVVGGALCLFGFARFGVPAAWRALRGRARDRSPDGRDLPLAFLAFLAATALVAFVLQLVRYPQVEGDQIKATYLFFAAPTWAVFTVAAWTYATARSGAARVLLPAWAVLYALSYGAATLSLFL